MTDRNLKGLFFKMSGYMPQEVDEMIYRQKAVKQALKEQKQRKREEQLILNFSRHKISIPPLDAIIKAKRNMIIGKRKSKPERLKEQIQNGFDLAKRWSAE